jgi:hypothetical protein
MNKYHAIKHEYDEMIFDSGFELDVYKCLKKAVTYTESDIRLIVKPNIVVKPRFKVFKERKWKCDFRLEHDEWGAINIEAKGFPTNQFTVTLEMLEGFNPVEFNRTVLVSYSVATSHKYRMLNDRIFDINKLHENIVNENYWRILND